MSGPTADPTLKYSLSKASCEYQVIGCTLSSLAQRLQSLKVIYAKLQ
jgi:hypothetical protein